MSSLATALRRAAPGRSGAARSSGVLRLRPSTNAALGTGLAAGLALVVFLTTGGTDLGPNTWTEIALTLLGFALAIAVLLWGASGRAWGAGTLILFAALAVLTAVSIAWSVQPDNSWLEANRTLSYLAAFAGALALARLYPSRWPALVGAVAVLATAVSAYALLAKVFPATIDPTDAVGRVLAPFGYWNATGLMAALGLPACLWAGARHDRGRALRAFAVPAIAILVAVIVLSYSRSALLAALVGVGAWFALVPARLRAALVLALGLAGAAAITGWALLTHPLTHDNVPLASRTTAGHEFGLVLLLVLVAMTACGFAAALAIDRAVLPPALRRRIGIALVALVALIPLGGVAALAASSRGLPGEVSHVWNTLTNPNEGVGDNPGRLVQLGNSRPRYWSEGLKVGEHALLKGVGAVGYGTARTRYTHDPWIVQHAHSYEIEAFADFGLIGLALNLALAVAWCLAAARAIGARARVPARFRRGAPAAASGVAVTGPIDPPEAAASRPGASAASLTAPAPPPGRAPAEPLDRSAERAGLLTLLCVVITFAVHSSIDWTWFIPGTALPALVCAGWLAGRGPPAEPVGRTRRRRSVTRNPAVGAAVAGLVALAVLGAWAIWQPLRSANADSAAIGALNRADTKSAIADAQAAAARDPLSVEPLWDLSAIFSAAGQQRAAHAELVEATGLQPLNPATWQALGDFDLHHRQPRDALGALERALALDLSNTQTVQDIAQAQASLRTSAGSSRGRRSSPTPRG